MALITWNNNLSVNIKGLDLQHQRLIDTINKLHDAMSKGQSNQSLSGILNDLAGYTKTHFSSEEELFKKYNYPGSTKHKTEHDNFIKKVSEFINGFEAGKIGLSLEVMVFLNKWLTEHIKVSDKAYTSFLNNKGIN